MAQAILASDKVIKEQPELIAKLVRATLRGLNDIMEDPKGSAKSYVGIVKKHAGRVRVVAARVVLAKGAAANGAQLGVLRAASRVDVSLRQDRPRAQQARLTF